MHALIVVPIHLLSLAEQAVVSIAGELPGSAFTIQLSHTGQQPATHVACQPHLREAILSQVAAFADRPEFAGSSVFVASSDADHLPMIARSLGSLGLFICE